MVSGENILIVEDEDEWSKIYQRAAHTQLPDPTVKVATDLADAERLIDSTKFAVAFVDIGLDVSDDRNVDGLLVMEKIRAMGDETSIVVVTGRAGQDVLPITRDAFMKYDAYDTIRKSTATPEEIEHLLSGGLGAYRSKTLPERMDARDSILGTADASVWDYEVTKAIEFAGDSGQFYKFLNELFGRYLPLVARRGHEQAQVDAEKRVVYGAYWSRATAQALLICLGAADTFAEALRALAEDASFPSGSRIGDPIRKLTSHGVKGAVFVVVGSSREEFGST